MPTSQGVRRAPQTKSKRRKRRKKAGPLLISILALVGLGAALLIYQAIFTRQESIAFMEATPISTSSTYLNTGDGLLYQTDGQIHFYHLTDNKKNYTYGMGASDIRMSGSSAMTVVYNSASLQVVGKKAPLTFTGTVHAVECGNEHLAVLRTTEEGVDSILILTADGEQIDQRSFPDQFIVDFGLYKTTGEMLWIETLGINSTMPTTTISIYDLNRRDVIGVITIQDQLVDDVYITQKSFFAAGTNQIIRYTHDGNKEVYRNTIYGYQIADFSAASGTPTFLLTPRGGDFHSVKLLTLLEDSAPEPVETYLQLPGEGVAAFIMNNRLVVAGREKLFTYSVRAKLQSEATFEQPIDAAVKLTDNTLLVSSNGTYYLTRMK